ncbi:TPA: TraK family protein [Legionella pneumophila]
MNNSLIKKMMTKDSSKPKSTAGKNKVAFLVLRDEISEALAKGWSMTAIWETLHDEENFTASYNTFRLYILKYLNGQMPGYGQKESINQRHKKQESKLLPEKKTASIPSFTYNPIPDPEKLL